MNSTVVKMFKNSPVIPTFTNLKAARCFGMIKTCTKLEGFFGPKEAWPELLREIADKDQDFAMAALGLAIAFLEDALIADKTMKPGQFLRYAPETQN